jgi:hypothetical protein
LPVACPSTKGAPENELIFYAGLSK